MIVTNKTAGHVATGSQPSLSQPSFRSEEGISTNELLGMSLNCVYRWLSSLLLRSHLRSLERLADYFTWQQENGAAGLADTHKRIAMARSELRKLQL